MISSESKNLALLAHLAPLIGYFFAIGQILVPLTIFLLAKDPFVKMQAREALNAQISFTVYFLICLFLFSVLIGYLLIFFLGIFVIWTMISASIAVSKGKTYNYPYIFRLVS
ncbi:hypothetical protein A946_10195 [Methylacidiphilum kamchatkense Kam1]|uniref:Tic20 family protein n=1 Tax=Methylacidiphilum kamchatkense Kam1 TaxID=1202785 RepID=A0A0C1V2V8_9BACT|nr:DUF4870 domain-containing protein [Methylacidiphilum kamchatkense]KIE58005.1 hypothetical protein A946_10195 [Methylacidiphilum kamchatkense Kam1]QDQ42445.1 hypothetical protein kam1_1218 [Methylacidiphilum kamchatkense Kam1]